MSCGPHVPPAIGQLPGQKLSSGPIPNQSGPKKEDSDLAPDEVTLLLKDQHVLEPELTCDQWRTFLDDLATHEPGNGADGKHGPAEKRDESRDDLLARDQDCTKDYHQLANNSCGLVHEDDKLDPSSPLERLLGQATSEDNDGGYDVIVRRAEEAEKVFDSLKDNFDALALSTISGLTSTATADPSEAQQELQRTSFPAASIPLPPNSQGTTAMDDCLSPWGVSLLEDSLSPSLSPSLLRFPSHDDLLHQEGLLQFIAETEGAHTSRGGASTLEDPKPAPSGPPAEAHPNVQEHLRTAYGRIHEVITSVHDIMYELGVRGPAWEAPSPWPRDQHNPSQGVQGPAAAKAALPDDHHSPQSHSMDPGAPQGAVAPGQVEGAQLFASGTSVGDGDAASSRPRAGHTQAPLFSKTDSSELALASRGLGEPRGDSYEGVVDADRVRKIPTSDSTNADVANPGGQLDELLREKDDDLIMAEGAFHFPHEPPIGGHEGTLNTGLPPLRSGSPHGCTPSGHLTSTPESSQGNATTRLEGGKDEHTEHPGGLLSPEGAVRMAGEPQVDLSSGGSGGPNMCSPSRSSPYKQVPACAPPTSQPVITTDHERGTQGPQADTPTHSSTPPALPGGQLTAVPQNSPMKDFSPLPNAQLLQAGHSSRLVQSSGPSLPEAVSSAEALSSGPYRPPPISVPEVDMACWSPQSSHQQSPWTQRGPLPPAVEGPGSAPGGTMGAVVMTPVRGANKAPGGQGVYSGDWAMEPPLSSSSSSRHSGFGGTPPSWPDSRSHGQAGSRMSPYTPNMRGHPGQLSGASRLHTSASPGPGPSLVPPPHTGHGPTGPARTPIGPTGSQGYSLSGAPHGGPWSQLVQSATEGAPPSSGASAGLPGNVSMTSVGSGGLKRRREGELCQLGGVMRSPGAVDHRVVLDPKTGKPIRVGPTPGYGAYPGQEYGLMQDTKGALPEDMAYRGQRMTMTAGPNKLDGQPGPSLHSPASDSLGYPQRGMVSPMGSQGATLARTPPRMAPGGPYPLPSYPGGPPQATVMNKGSLMPGSMPSQQVMVSPGGQYAGGQRMMRRVGGLSSFPSGSEGMLSGNMGMVTTQTLGAKQAVNALRAHSMPIYSSGMGKQLSLSNPQGMSAPSSMAGPPIHRASSDSMRGGMPSPLGTPMYSPKQGPLAGTGASTGEMFLGGRSTSGGLLDHGVGPNYHGAEGGMSNMSSGGGGGGYPGGLTGTTTSAFSRGPHGSFGPQVVTYGPQGGATGGPGVQQSPSTMQHQGQTWSTW